MKGSFSFRAGARMTKPRMWRQRGETVVWNWAVAGAYLTAAAWIAQDARGDFSWGAIVAVAVCLAFAVWAIFAYGAPCTWQSIENRERRPYLERFYILPRNPFFSPLVHIWRGGDFHQAPHCHPAGSWSILLCGRLREFVIYREKEWSLGSWNYHGRIASGCDEAWRDLRPFAAIYRPAEFRHRIEILPSGRLPPITIFIFFRKRREWGFWCPQKSGKRIWTPWKKVVDQGGCGDA